MDFCQKCGAKISRGNVCSTCGHHTNPLTDIIKSNALLILLLLGIAVILFFLVVGGIAIFAFLNLAPKSSSPQSNTPVLPQFTAQLKSCPYDCCDSGDFASKSCPQFYGCKNNACVQLDCPYECCDGGDYKLKSCQQDYKCESHQCKPLDSDSDGLYDYEERQLGTNPNLADSDGDTLSDYQEVRILHTNPLNKNTDGDRYDDNLDPNPLVKNSAVVTITIKNEKGEYDYANLALVFGGIAGSAVGSCVLTGGAGCLATSAVVISVLDTLGLSQRVIYHDNMDLLIANQGNDYTSYVTYDVNYYTESTLVLSKSENLSRLDAGASISPHYVYDIKAIDVPGALLRILNKKPVIEKKIENIKYEQFN